MDKSAQLTNFYEQLLEINKKQVFIVNKEEYDNQLDDLNQLEEQKAEIILNINTYQESNVVEIGQYGDNVLSLLQEIRQINDEIYNKILFLYQQSSHTMRQVSVQRKTLNTYGGVNSYDVQSYYFDQKK